MNKGWNLGENCFGAEKDLFISRFQVRTDDLPFKSSVKGNRRPAAPQMK